MTAECLNKGDQYDILALDFSKAFDKVLHVHLFHAETVSLWSTWVHHSIIMTSGLTDSQ